MAIIKDNSRGTYYINYKFKQPNGTWKNVNIKNKAWKMYGEDKVGYRYMQSIEHDEIERDKCKRNYTWHEGDPLTLKQACDAYLLLCKSEGIDDETIYNYRLSFKNYLFNIFSENERIDKVLTLVNIDNFRIGLTSKGLTNRTINNKLVAVKKLVKFCKKRHYVSREVADDIIDNLEPLKEGSRVSEKENFFTHGEEDVRKFIKTFDERDSEWKIPILTLFYGALRIGEWQGIKRNCINFENDFILIKQQIDNHGHLKDHTKTGHDRIVRLPHSFMLELKNYVNERATNDDEFIFTGSNGGAISRNAVRRIVDIHLNCAGLQHITLHGLRHSFATRMFDKGYDVRAVQEHLGHTNLGTTMAFYIHYTHDKKAKSLEDLV